MMDTKFFKNSIITEDGSRVSPQTLMFNDASQKEHKFFIARDYEYTNKEGTCKTVKEYTSFLNINKFLNWKKLKPGTEDDSLYEMLSDKLVEIYDIDGDYTKDNFLNKDGSKRTAEDIINDFIDARLDFQEEFYSDISLVRDDFIIKQTLNPKNIGTPQEKISFHILIRNRRIFETISDLKKFTTKFYSYAKEFYPKLIFDKSIYSSNRAIRILGCCKLGQPDRKSFRYPNFSNMNDTCDERLFYASFLCGGEYYYPEISDDEDFIIPIPSIGGEELKFDGDKIVVEKLIKLILKTIDNNTSPLCDEEIINKLNYNTWRNLVFSAFNSICQSSPPSWSDNNLLEQVFNIIFPYYRHSNTIKQDETFKNMINYIGVYKVLGINWLYHYASKNKDFQKEFPEIAVELKYAQDIKYYNKLVKKVDSLDYTKILPVNYIHEFKNLVQLSSKNAYSLKYIQHIINFICCNVCGGGRNYMYLKTKEYNKDIQKYMSFYSINKYQNLTTVDGFLNCSINILNEDFIEELEAYRQQQKIIQDGKKISKDDYLPYPPIKKLKFITRDYPGRPSIISNMLEKNIFTSARKAIFQPYLLPPKINEQSDCLNLFTEFQHLDTLEDSTVSIDTYLNSSVFSNFRDYLCNFKQEPDVFHYIDNYIAHMIQKPDERPDKMIIFSGAQGTGKDRFMSFLESLIGPMNTLHVPSMDSLLDKFNMSQANKLLIKVNEISDKGDHRSKHELLKEKICAEYISVQPKGKDTFQLEHCSRYFGFSNKDNILNIENTDRRFVMVKTNNDMADVEIHHSIIYKDSKKLDIIRSAFKYYATKDISQYKIRIIPDTQYKTEQKIDSLPTTLKFLQNIFEESPHVNIVEGINIHTDDIYCKFQSWCSKTGNNKIVNRQTMVKDFEKLQVIQQRILVNKIRKLGYIIEYDLLQINFRNYLKNKDFILPQADDTE
jgi:hypothetical protein